MLGFISPYLFLSNFSPLQFVSFNMFHLLSGINPLILSINLIPVSLSPTRLFLFLPHLPLLILDSYHPYLPHSFAPDSKPTSFTNLSHHRLSSNHRSDTMDFPTRPFLLSNWVFVFSCFQLFIAFLCFLVPCGRLSIWMQVATQQSQFGNPFDPHTNSNRLFSDPRLMPSPIFLKILP